MKIDRKFFYDNIRKRFLKLQTLRQEQVDSMNAVIDEFEKSGNNDLRHLAYIFATIYHETGVRIGGVWQVMLPIEEIGKGRNKRYGLKMKFSGERYLTPDKLYYGRGFVQLTWYENYAKFAKIIGENLLNLPELALKPTIAAKIAIVGMEKGLFTGVGLNKYFNANTENPEQARRIINGLDQYKLIAEYYYSFKKCLKPF